MRMDNKERNPYVCQHYFVFCPYRFFRPRESTPPKKIYVCRLPRSLKCRVVHKEKWSRSITQKIGMRIKRYHERNMFIPFNDNLKGQRLKK